MLSNLWRSLGERVDPRQVVAAAGLAPILDAAQQHFSGFAFSNPVLWVSAFWFADFTLGSGRALAAKDWLPSRAAKSVRKWVWWMAALFVAYCLRTSGVWGMGVAGGMVEAAILLAEGGSILRHLAALSDSPAQREVLTWYSDSLRDLSRRRSGAKEDPDPGPDEGPTSSSGG